MLRMYIHMYVCYVQYVCVYIVYTLYIHNVYTMHIYTHTHTYICVCVCVCVYSFYMHACSVTSVVSDSATLWTIAHQAPLSWDSPGKNTRVGCHSLL